MTKKRVYATRRLALRVRDTLTPEEQMRRHQDMLLARCKELTRLRAREKKLLKPKKKKPAARFRRGCKECKAKQFLEKHGKKAP